VIALVRRISCWRKARSMARRIGMEEFHLTVCAPRGPPDAEYDAIQQILVLRESGGRWEHLWPNHAATEAGL
jgi:hypothetical protein